MCSRLPSSICLLSFLAQQTRPATPVEQVGVVAGVVVDSGGGILPGVTVTLRSGQRVERTVTTSSTGEFRFENVPPGSYVVEAALPGFVNLTTGVTVGGTGLKPLRADSPGLCTAGGCHRDGGDAKG